MKQKIIITLLSATLAFSIVACGADGAKVATTENTTKTTSLPTESTDSSIEITELPVKETESEDLDVYFKDDILKIEDATIKIKETKFQEPNTSFGETNPTLIIVFDFTNNRADVLSPGTAWLACFTAQQETDVAFENLEVGISPQGEEYVKANEMAFADIKPGATVESVIAYQIKYPDSPVILNATQGAGGKELGKKTINLGQNKANEVETNKEIISTNSESETARKEQKSSELNSSQKDNNTNSDKTQSAEQLPKEFDDKTKEKLIALGYSELTSNGSGYAIETLSDFTYSVPDTWFKVIKDGYVTYKTDYGFILFHSQSNDDIDEPLFLDMFVDATITGYEKLENYVEISKEESKIGNSKSVKLHYTSDVKGAKQVDYIMTFTDSSKATILIDYSVDAADSQEEISNGTIENVFDSIKLLH